MPSAYRPGKKKYGTHQMSKNRAARVRTAFFTMALMRYEVDEVDAEHYTGDSGEVGDSFRIIINHASGRVFTFSLTALTTEELEAIRDFCTLALRVTTPIVKERDRKAAQRYADGDDSFSRSYRQLPQFIIRERSLGSYDQSVLDGLEYALNRSPAPGDSKGGLRAKGSRVADEVPSNSEPKDDGSQDSEPKELG